MECSVVDSALNLACVLGVILHPWTVAFSSESLSVYCDIAVVHSVSGWWLVVVVVEHIVGDVVEACTRGEKLRSLFSDGLLLLLDVCA